MQNFISMSVVNLNAAGIDVGGKSHFVCVAQNNVQELGAFTEDLHLIVQHLQKQSPPCSCYVSISIYNETTD